MVLSIQLYVIYLWPFNFFYIIFSLVCPLCWSRSDKTGKVLAEVLLHSLQGNRWHHLILLQKVDNNVASLYNPIYLVAFYLWSRPVTLVGFSLGARVIFKCLQCLSESKGDNGNLESSPLAFLCIGILFLYCLLYKFFILSCLMQLE